VTLIRGLGSEIEWALSLTGLLKLRSRFDWRVLLPARLMNIIPTRPTVCTGCSACALDALVTQGKVRYLGVSNWQAWKIAKALGISECKNLARFDTLQAYYSIAGRGPATSNATSFPCWKAGSPQWRQLGRCPGSGRGRCGRSGDGEGWLRRRPNVSAGRADIVCARGRYGRRPWRQ